MHMIFVSATLAFTNYLDDQGGGGVVDSGCKGIYNDQNEYFLDLNPVNYDICTERESWIFSIYLIERGFLRSQID
jgi:hypothetical protein